MSARLVDTPALLSTVGAGLLVHGIEALEEDELAHVGTERGLEAGDRAGLLRRTRHGGAVGGAAAGPAALGDDGALAAGRGADLVLHVLDKGTGAVGADTAVEKGVRVGGAVVRGLAEGGVGDDGDEGVNGDDLAGVAGGAEHAAGGGEGGDDVRSGALAGVDDFVADVDGVDDRPVGRKHADQLAEVALHVGDGVDAGEELHARGGGDGGGQGAHVAADIVGADEGVALGGELSHLGLDLLGGTAAAIIGHQVVGEAVAASLGAPAVAVAARGVVTLGGVQVAVAHGGGEGGGGVGAEGQEAEKCGLHDC